MGGGRALDALLSVIERAVPVERIWLEVSEAEGTELPVLGTEEITRLADQLTELGRSLPAGMSPDQRVDTLLINLPGDLTKLRAELLRRLGGTNG